MNFEETAHNIIDLTLKAGASDCDVVLAKSYGKSISCRFGKIEDLDESNEKTIGIRALVDQRQAFVSSSDIETDNIDKLVSKITPNTNPNINLTEVEFKTLIDSAP